MKPKILLLEDDMELGDTVAKFLHAKVYEVVQSFDGEEASEYFESAAHGVIKRSEK